MGLGRGSTTDTLDPATYLNSFTQTLGFGLRNTPTEVNNDGKLWAHEARLVFNSGAYGAFKPRVTLGGADRSGGPYVIPNVGIDSYMVYTNNIPCGHMRSPAKPQTIFAVESHMDMIAREMGIDPLEFRLRNLMHDGEHLRAKDGSTTRDRSTFARRCQPCGTCRKTRLHSTP